MKLAYRIVTPILAAGAIILSIFLKMFSFNISVSTYNLPFEYSIIDAITRLSGANSSSGTSTLLETVKPMLPSAISFFVFLAIALLILIAIIFVGSLTNNRKPVIILSASGLASLMICIITSNIAFAKLTDGETIDLSAVIAAMGSSELFSTIASIAVSLLKITASLSTAFYSVFGMFILIILWCIVAGFVIKTPIQKTKKDYRRSKPMRRIIKKAPAASAKKEKKAKPAAEAEISESKAADAADAGISEDTAAVEDTSSEAEADDETDTDDVRS